MPDHVYTLYIDETGDTELPGDSAVVGLLVDGRVQSEDDRRVRLALETACSDLAWAIHAAALNSPQGFLTDRRKRPPVVRKALEAHAAALERERLEPRTLKDWAHAARLRADHPAARAAQALADATHRGRQHVGDMLASLPERLGNSVSLVATVCGQARPLEKVGTLVADAYVLALVRTFRTVAELVAQDDGHAFVDVHVLTRNVKRARDQAVQNLSPTFALQLADHALTKARLRTRVTFGGTPQVRPWNATTPAMLVLADHASNRFLHALRQSGHDDVNAFLSRVRHEVRVDGCVTGGGQENHGLAYMDRTAREAPRWARLLPAQRDA